MIENKIKQDVPVGDMASEYRICVNCASEGDLKMDIKNKLKIIGLSVCIVNYLVRARVKTI